MDCTLKIVVICLYDAVNQRLGIFLKMKFKILYVRFVINKAFTIAGGAKKIEKEVRCFIQYFFQDY